MQFFFHKRLSNKYRRMAWQYAPKRKENFLCWYHGTNRFFIKGHFVSKKSKYIQILEYFFTRNIGGKGMS